MHTSKKMPLWLLLWMAILAMAVNADELQDRLHIAQYQFDRALAEALLPEFEQRAKQHDNEAAWLDYASAALLVAELKRGDYEHQELDKKAKRELGKNIDEVAKNALASLEALPESSERYRLEADLLGPMIRSKYKGMKLQPRLEKAIDRALELDEKNPRAWVSKARRPLFAPEQHGGDPALALLYLNRALAIDQAHVQALLFRGAAHAKLGNTLLSEADWAQALELNPNTAEARDRLLNIEIPFE